MYGNFKDRADQWESAVKTSREYQEEEKRDEQDDRNDFGGRDYEKAHLSTGDIALIAGCGIIEAGLALWYWLLCMIWAYRKAKHMGVGSVLWVWATFVRSGNSKYCDRCGKPFVKECPDCGQTLDLKADYCGNCGKKLNENKEA